ncbi:metallophosphoesterase family protein [Piscinibacter sp. XHJ-5]|uniref:metallophosphoesterase family protein n=1 Tax=Piscinibacter sp. XHJ-5 TaxID=3037797 RepID=UPI002452A15B|nr:metallophosphoesterase family protein [Piscinibacter sp. XHJ-5]
MRIGLISDTHGLLREEAVAALQGSERIVHAGDIVDPQILEALARIAPVTAVRGNNDQGAWALALPETAVLQAGAISILVIHDLKTLRAGAAAGHQVVVSGHSHQPKVERRAGVLHVNPGSAGPRRFRLPISLGRLDIDGAEVSAALIHLQVG